MMRLWVVLAAPARRPRPGFQMYDQETGKPVGDAESYCRDGIKVGTCSGGPYTLPFSHISANVPHPKLLNVRR